MRSESSDASGHAPADLNVAPQGYPQLHGLSELHNEAGTALFAACTSELFPCDVLAFSVLERSLNLIKGFRLIVSSGGYSSGVGLLRMQLDNLLRFNGVALARDPHEIAYEVITGTRLSRLKDRTGAAMNDKRLVELLAKKNLWVEQVYELASGYIHLSSEHVLQFLSRSLIDADGTRQFNIGDEEDHIPTNHKIALVESFATVSRGVPRIVKEWKQVRHLYGTNEELKQRFNRVF